MTKEQKLYCKIGQAVVKTMLAATLFAIPMAMCNLAGYITTLF